VEVVVVEVVDGAVLDGKAVVGVPPVHAASGRAAAIRRAAARRTVLLGIGRPGRRPVSSRMCPERAGRAVRRAECGAG
jgi:hypothetical protein